MIDLEEYRRYLADAPALAVDPLALEPLGIAAYINHWSPSSHDKFRQCPESWRRKYITKEPERPVEPLLTGSAVHRGLEENFRRKIDTHADLPVAELVEFYDDFAFDWVVHDQQERAGLDAKWETSAEESKTRGRKMLGEYQRLVSPRIQPSAVESKVTVDIGTRLPVEGRADLVREGAPTIDWKTGKAAQKKPKESWRIQGVIYREATGQPIEFHSVSASPKHSSVSVWTPLEAPELLFSPTENERTEMQRTLAAIEADADFYLAKYGPDDPWPTFGRFHIFACGSCTYRPTCPAWEET